MPFNFGAHLPHFLEFFHSKGEKKTLDFSHIAPGRQRNQTGLVTILKNKFNQLKLVLHILSLFLLKKKKKKEYVPFLNMCVNAQSCLTLQPHGL